MCYKVLGFSSNYLHAFCFLSHYVMNSRVTYNEITDLLAKCTDIYDDNAYKNTQYARFFTDKATDFQAGIVVNGDAVYCIFRGSNSLKDWYYDLTTNKIELQDGIKIHKGFYEQLHNHKCFDSMLKAMMGYVTNTDINKIYITGHSLGGALATLFAFELSKEMNKDITLVSFASPRIGNEKWVSMFNALEKITHIRVANERDPIPKSPVYNYYHCGEELFLESGEFHWLCYDVKKHECVEYKKGLERLAKNV